MSEDQKREFIRKLENMSAACIQMAAGAPDGVSRQNWEGATNAYDHAIDIINGTDETGPAYEKAKQEINRLIRDAGGSDV